MIWNNVKLLRNFLGEFYCFVFCSRDRRKSPKNVFQNSRTTYECVSDALSVCLCVSGINIHRNLTVSAPYPQAQVMGEDTIRRTWPVKVYRGKNHLWKTILKKIKSRKFTLYHFFTQRFKRYFEKDFRTNYKWKKRKERERNPKEFWEIHTSSNANFVKWPAGEKNVTAVITLFVLWHLLVCLSVLSSSAVSVTICMSLTWDNISKVFRNVTAACTMRRAGIDEVRTAICNTSQQGKSETKHLLNMQEK